MMFRFPFYNYPYNYPYYRYYNGYYKNNVQDLKPKKEEKDSITNSNEVSNTTNSRFDSSPDQAIFEILGIKLYLDDLIILGILFFLYQQNVKDEMLYIYSIFIAFFII